MMMNPPANPFAIELLPCWKISGIHAKFFYEANYKKEDYFPLKCISIIVLIGNPNGFWCVT